MKVLKLLSLIVPILVATPLFGQASLTDAQVMAAINRALTGKRHQIGLTLNDKQTFFLSGLLCTTCQTSGYTIYVYTPESWIELKAVQARREMLPFGIGDVTPEMRLPYIHIMALPSTADYLDANGMGMASSVHRVVLSSTDNSEVVQPLSESRSTVESNSALRSFTQTSAGAVFSLEDVERLRSKDSKQEFFVVVVGDNLNKYFKVKARFFRQLFGNDPSPEFEGTGASQSVGAKSQPTPDTPVTPLNSKGDEPTPNTTEVTSVPNQSPQPLENSATVDLDHPMSQVTQPQPTSFGFKARNWEQGGAAGAEIVRIIPDSAAEAAGLHVGDVIRSVDGKNVRNVADLEQAIANRQWQSTIRVTYFFHTNLGWIPGIEKTLTAQQ